MSIFTCSFPCGSSCLSVFCLLGNFNGCFWIWIMPPLWQLENWQPENWQPENWQPENWQLHLKVYSKVSAGLGRLDWDWYWVDWVRLDWDCLGWIGLGRLDHRLSLILALGFNYFFLRSLFIAVGVVQTKNVIKIFEKRPSILLPVIHRQQLQTLFGEHCKNYGLSARSKQPGMATPSMATSGS